MRRIVLINLALVLLVLLAAEALFGTWFSGAPWGALNIPRSVNRLFDVSGLYPGRDRIQYSRDTWGLRGRYERIDAIDILTLGGSTTDQRYIDDAETWQEQLRQRVAADGTAISVVNAGLDGQSTVGHLAALERWLAHVPGLKTRFVLAYIGVNDLHLANQAQFDDMRSPSRWRRVKQFVENNSAMAALYKTISGTIRARAAKIVHGSGPVWHGPWVEVAPPPLPVADDDRLAAYKLRVHRLIAAIRASGAEAIIVTQSRADYRVAPGRVLGRPRGDGGVDTGAWSEQTAFNRQAMAACRAEAAICLDLGSELTFGDGDFYDWVHTTPEGNARIAEYLHRGLRDRL